MSEEGFLAATDVKVGAVVFKYQADSARTISGFYTKLRNCVGPMQSPIVVGLRYRGDLRAETAEIPVYGTPLNLYTRTGGVVFPPLDMAQEYRVRLETPIVIEAGTEIYLEIISGSHITSGIVGGLQFAGTWSSQELRWPFRETKNAGPVCALDWSSCELVGVGNEIPFDSQSAPQNNAVVIDDEDGTLFHFTAFYSVDEQHGRGRDGSIARVYGYRKATDATQWEELGLVADVPPGMTYAGDPFAFRDLEGIPCLTYVVANGTNGFVDWTESWGYVQRSQTRSFAGPWAAPTMIWLGFPRGELDGDRMVCPRIYARKRTNDYLVCWTHGGEDISARGAVLPNLETAITHEEIQQAPWLVRDQDEGSGGFIVGDKGYFGGWQIPNINDVTSIQRLYEFDLYDALNPEAWRPVPGSVGFTDGTNPIEDGGTSADCWSLSIAGGKLWASYIAWSATNKKNSILVRSASFDTLAPWLPSVSGGSALPDSPKFQFGVGYVWPYTKVAPVIEYAVGDICSLAVDISGRGASASIGVYLAPSARELCHGGVGLEISREGTRFISRDGDGAVSELATFHEPKFIEEKIYTVELRRDGSQIEGIVDGEVIASLEVSDAKSLKYLSEPQRFKFYSEQGTLFSLENILVKDEV